jgi:hypothetical protein
MIYELSVFQSIPLTQVVKTKPERAGITSFIVFGQTIKHNIRTRKPVSTLSLHQSMAVRTSVKNLSVGHVLQLSQVAAKNPIFLNVLSGYFPWHTIKRPKWEKVTSLFNPNQNVTGHGCHSVKSTLNLSQSIITRLIRSRAIVSNINYINGSVGWLSNPDFNFLNPVFTRIAKVRFKYGATEFYVRKPDFDDTYKYDFTRISRRSRGGDLIISRDSIWPATKTLNIRFTFLSQLDIDNFLSFFKLTLGKKCRYLNYDSVEWEGFIMNPQTEATQLGRDNFSITVEFEGTPL